MSKIKLVIFDFDGTLADTFSWFLTASSEASDKFNFRKITHEEIGPLRMMDTKKILKHLGIRWWILPKLAVFMREKMAKDASSIKLFEGTAQMLKELSKSGAIITIVSSNSIDNVKAILTPELTKYIQEFSCGSSLFGKKSKFRAMTKKYKCSPSETICIGDETRDIEAAKAVEAIAGSVSWGYADVKALKQKNPDYIFNSLEEINEQLRPVLISSPL